jgi:hypothetical protein
LSLDKESTKESEPKGLMPFGNPMSAPSVALLRYAKAARKDMDISMPRARVQKTRAHLGSRFILDINVFKDRRQQRCAWLFSFYSVF